MRIADGIHRLGSGLVNSYLLVDGTAITIVDAGLPGQWNDLLAELSAMGRSLDDVRALVLHSPPVRLKPGPGQSLCGIGRQWRCRPRGPGRLVSA